MLISSKTSDTPRIGLDLWFPYYAGYSSPFVESVIKHAQYLGVSTSGTVFDPWVGAGTSLTTSAKLGYDVMGIDVNPFAADISRSKSPNIIKIEQEILDFLKDLKRLKWRHVVTRNTSIEQFYDAGSAKKIEWALYRINRYVFPRSLNFDNETLIDFKSFMRTALILTALKFKSRARSSNPTWEIGNPSATIPNNFFDFLEENCIKMIRDLKDYYPHDLRTGSFKVITGDTRKTSINFKSNIIITSPPYLTRIDYIRNTRIAMSFYATEGSIREYRDSCMGAPVIRNDSQYSDNWGIYAKELWNKVGNHPSKASRSYYLKTLEQYLSDMYRSIENLKSTFSDTTLAYFVVQSSYYKDVYIDLKRLYVEAFEANGIEGELVSSHLVRNVMASVNSKSRGYLQDKQYFEDTVLFRMK